MGDKEENVKGGGVRAGGRDWGSKERKCGEVWVGIFVM